MSTTPESKEEIHRLFRKHVPEVADGSVEVVNIARAIGRMSLVAVRSQAKTVEPVGACGGLRGNRLKAMAGELPGEQLTVVRWDGSPEIFIKNAFAGELAPEVALDEATHTALVTVNNPIQHGPDIDLIGELTGWSVRVQSRGAK